MTKPSSSPSSFAWPPKKEEPNYLLGWYGWYNSNNHDESTSISANGNTVHSTTSSSNTTTQLSTPSLVPSATPSLTTGTPNHHYSKEQMILATSSSTSSFIIPMKIRSPTGRIYGSDRKGIFDHWKGKSLFLSTFRTSFIQATNIYTGYVTDQLEAESARDELLVMGKITNAQFEKESDEWEAKEWAKRWATFPKKATTAILKFHAITFVMRFYEYIGANLLRLSIPTMDKLTKDVCASARRKEGRRLSNERMTKTTGNSSSTSSTSSSNSRNEMGVEMFYTCFSANIISILADATVQQCILMYGYYTFIHQQRKNRSLLLTEETNDKSDKVESESNETKQGVFDTIHTIINDNIVKYFGSANDKEEEKKNKALSVEDEALLSESLSKEDYGAIVLSFVYKCTNITLYRSMALLTLSVGGAIGTVMKPGLGTLLGMNLGEAVANGF